MSYYTKITKAGLAAITAAMNNNTKVPITYMAFGDGNGYIPEPNENATELVNEVFRVGLNKIEPHSKNPNWLVCEAIIPSSVGGFNIRELGLYDKTGTVLLAIANYPPTYKPSITEGSAKIQTIRIIIQIDNSGNFELIIDPDVVLATVKMLNDYQKNSIVNVNCVDDLIKINPRNGMKIITSSYHNSENGSSDSELLGGAFYIYDQSQSHINNGGTIIDGWVLIPENNTITPYHFGWSGKDLAEDMEAFQKCFDAVKHGQTIRFWHTAHLEKQIGKHADIYGAEGRPYGRLILNGGQPCLILRAKKNVTVILDGAEIYTETACLGLLDLVNCSRCKVLSGKLTGGNFIRETSEYKFPPIDGTTGHAEKGAGTTGFNTTTLSPDIGGMSNNMVVTQNETSGGYGGQFPQFDGTTAQTWGSWRGGQLGNHSEGIRVIGGFNNTIENIEIHGFNGSSIRLGLLRSLDGLTSYSRISDFESRKVAPKKTIIKNNYLHDCYIGGCHQDRAVDTVFEFNDVENMGHKNASIAHDYVDPGYGFSTSRSMPNFGFKVRDNTFNNCYRKGIDCHQGSQFWIERNTVRGTMFHAIGIAIDDDFADIAYQPHLEHFSIISDNDLESHECGIFYANGQFGRKVMEDKKKQWERLHVVVRNNLIKSINPFFYNFGHSPFEITGNTFIFSAPFKHQKPVSGSKSAVYFGSFGRGVSSGSIFSKNKFFNSKDGNFAFMLYFENGTGVNKAIHIVNNHIDITPWFNKENSNAMYLHNDVDYRPGIASIAITYSSGKMIQDAVIEQNTVCNDFNHDFFLTNTNGGTGFVGYPIIDGHGRIVGVQVLSGGTGYGIETKITIRNKGRSIGATFTPNIINGVITSVNVLNQGCFYRTSYNLSVPRGLVRYFMNNISGSSCYDEGIGSNSDTGCILSVMKNDLSVPDIPFSTNGSIRYLQTKLTGQYAVHHGGIFGGTLMFWFSIEKYQETNGALFIANQSIDEITNAAGSTTVNFFNDGFKLDNLAVFLNGNSYQGELLEYGKPYFIALSSSGLSGNNLIFGSNSQFNGAFLNAKYSMIQIHRGYTYSSAEILDTYNSQKSLFSETL